MAYVAAIILTLGFFFMLACLWETGPAWWQRVIVVLLALLICYLWYLGMAAP